MQITSIQGREILDSRGNPTVEAEVVLSDGSRGLAAVPSGASTGAHEAHELRDGDTARYGGKGVRTAVANIEGEIARSLAGKDPEDQASIDGTMKDLDGTPAKSRLGANAILAVSLAVAKAVAVAKRQELYERIGELSGNSAYLLPLPMFNLMNGGKHGGWATDIQEFLMLPVGAKEFSEALRMGSEVFHALGGVLHEYGYATAVGDEGGYAPVLRGGNAEALALMREAASRAGYELGKDLAFGIDAAASEFFTDGAYVLKSEGKTLTPEAWASWLQELLKTNPLVSIEDGFAEDEWDGWKAFTKASGNATQIVGDDFLVTNTARLSRAIEERAANAILVKPNQIGTLTETLEAIAMAKRAGWGVVIAHRSGETEDTTIAHLAVGTAAGQIKTGSLCRSERTAKYNELLRIAARGNSPFAGGKALLR